MPIEKRLLLKAVEAPEEVADTGLSLRRHYRANPGLRVQIQEATQLNVHRRVRSFDDFLAAVNCIASTPDITLRGFFNQNVRVECSTPLGPATVDANTMHVQIAGKDMWNGPSDTHFGRSFYTITGTRR